MLRKPINLALLALLALVLAHNAAAEPGWYRVEVVLFVNTESNARNVEAWPQDSAQLDTVGNARHLAPAGSGEPYARLADSELKLGGVVAALRSSGVRKPVLHTGWKQPVRERRKAEPVWIDGGSSVYLADGQNSREIAGTLLLTRSRFLHVWTNLRYAEQGYPVTTYVMRDHRRMRSGELHYIDHPTFGLLILCTPM